MPPKTEFSGKSDSWITNQIKSTFVDLYHNFVFFGFKVSIEQLCQPIKIQKFFKINVIYSVAELILYSQKNTKFWFVMVCNSRSTFTNKLGFRWHAPKFYSLHFHFGEHPLGEIGGSDLPHYELESISTLYQVSKKLKAVKESLAPPEVSQLFN